MRNNFTAQHTYESCLAWCLLTLAGKKPTLKKELEIVNFSLRFTKKDFTIGHLEAVHNLFKQIEMNIDTDFRYECNSAAQLRKSKNIKIIACNVLTIIPLYLELTKERIPLIVYLDAYSLWKHHHYPHYIIVLEKDGNKYKILDPWDGKERKVSENVILGGVLMLKKYLGLTPRAIFVKR